MDNARPAIAPAPAPLRLAAIGCGGRTVTYFELAARLADRYRVIAAADPRPGRVERARAISANPDFRGFRDDRDILAREKLADVMIIGSQDTLHAAHAVAAMERGYDLLLEKPIASTLADTLRVHAAAGRLGRRVLVCHVLRYTPFYRTVKAIVDAGELGEIVSVNAVEGVGAWHQAHSFVRGHWSVTEKASPMIVAKSCHDLDILRWLVGRPCRRLSSFGSLTHFRPENAPAGAPARCTDGCPAAATCIYHAELYADRHRVWLSYVYDDEPGASREQILAWLRASPWGRCVYRCDNTAVDHQTVNIEFAGGTTATFTMSAFDSGRHLEILGTRARLRGGEFVAGATGHHIVVIEHGSHRVRHVRLEEPEGGYAGHGGGDPGLVRALYDEMRAKDPAAMTSSIDASVESHVMGFAAECSRRDRGRTIDLAEFAAGGGARPAGAAPPVAG